MINIKAYILCNMQGWPLVGSRGQRDRVELGDVGTFRSSLPFICLSPLVFYFVHSFVCIWFYLISIFFLLPTSPLLYLLFFKANPRHVRGLGTLQVRPPDSIGAFFLVAISPLSPCCPISVILQGSWIHKIIRCCENPSCQAPGDALVSESHWFRPVSIPWWLIVSITCVV